MHYLLLIVLCLYAPLLQAAENLTFSTLTDLSSFEPDYLEVALADYLDKEVKVRGFIYKNDAGQYVLSSRPGLASCCQTKIENVPHQIFLEGSDFNETGGKTVSVQGFFTLDPVRNHEGKLIQLYRLKDPHIRSVKNNATWTFLALLIGGVMWALFYVRKKRIT